MEKRIFGCAEFSDVVFKTSLSLIEKIFDFVLEDLDPLEANKSDLS